MSTGWVRRLGVEKNLARLPRESFVLAEFETRGERLGQFRGQPIHPVVVDGDGNRYIFAGVATRTREGGYRLDQFGRGEWLIEPGLIYRLADATSDAEADKTATFLRRVSDVFERCAAWAQRSLADRNAEGGSG